MTSSSVPVAISLANGRASVFNFASFCLMISLFTLSGSADAASRPDSSAIWAISLEGGIYPACVFEGPERLFHGDGQNIHFTPVLARSLLWFLRSAGSKNTCNNAYRSQDVFHFFKTEDVDNSIFLVQIRQNKIIQSAGQFHHGLDVFDGTGCRNGKEIIAIFGH